jgi:hypothetical protein
MNTRKPEADRLMNAAIEGAEKERRGLQKELCDKDEAGLSSIGVETR